MDNKTIRLELPEWDEMPDIGLYMDQVLVLMDKYIGGFLTIQNKESFLTPSMINNYVKHSVMPAPESKKYSKEHLAYLIIICLMKQSLSISSIKEITEMQLKNIDIIQLYSKFCKYYKNALNAVLKSEEISLSFNSNNDTILYLGIISNICRIVSEKELFNYLIKKEETTEEVKKDKKDKKEKKKDDNK